MNLISEKTSVSLWGILSALPVLVGLVFWLSVLWARAEANDIKMSKIEGEHKEIGGVISDIHDRVIRIEEKMNHNKGCYK